MRQERTVQATIFEVFAQHEIGCELKAMSQWLDGQPALISLVAGGDRTDRFADHREQTGHGQLARDYSDGREPTPKARRFCYHASALTETVP
jgi:hypothetical protein